MYEIKVIGVPRSLGHGSIHNLGKNFSNTGQWSVGGDKD